MVLTRKALTSSALPVFCDARACPPMARIFIILNNMREIPEMLIRGFFTASAAAILALSNSMAFANGCIIVRSGPMMSAGLDQHDGNEGQLEMTASYRYLFSDRHFRGREEEERRHDEQTDVRNSVHTVDLSISYMYDAKWTFLASLPYIETSRTSLYEHDRINRYESGSNGIGDLRLVAYRTLINNMSDDMTRLTLGLGVKLPTGEDDAKDWFHTTNGLVYRNVDQSIQPGDGGTGLIAELQLSRRMMSNTFGFLTASYLFNPEDTNGVDTHRSRTGEEVMSIPDSYVARLGLSQRVSSDYGVTVDAGFRIEGVPAEDLIGDENGFRRPGHAVYFEPAVNVQLERHRINISLPIAIERNRVKSVTDKANGVHGDAAFADSILMTSYSYRW